MKNLLLVLFVFPFAVCAMEPQFAEGVDPAHRLTMMSVHENVPESDPRVAQVRNWLSRAAKGTGEQEQAIAAACVRTAKFLLDGSRVRANPLDPLEALANAKPGVSMSEELMAYVDARKRAPGKTHAEAMSALRGAAR